MTVSEISLSRDDAVDAGMLVIGPGARIAPSVRIVPREDDGSEYGPVEVGANAIVRDGCVIGTGSRIGRYVLIGNNCVIRRRFTIGDRSVLSHLVSVQHDVTVGALCRISSLTHLAGHTVIEDRVQVGANVTTVDANAMTWPEKSGPLVGPTFRSGCRIGSGSTVLSGVVIGHNTLIGAGSLVTRNIPDNVVAYGHPCYVQRDRVQNR